ncbi:MAG: zinc ribbon domain-containing protein [Solirubrobacterales bacterium]
MAIAIFGISNDGLNLVVNLFALMLVVVWLALIVYTYLDARRRISDPFLVGCATIASFIPYLGTAVYTIVRPPEFLEDAHERELEIKAAELRVRQLKELSCPRCSFPIEKTYMRCPRCQCRLKNPCPSCSKPVDPRWALCPFCETALADRERASSRSPEGGKPAREERSKAPPAERAPKRRQSSRGKEPATSSEPPARKEPASEPAEEPREPTRRARKEPARSPREPARASRKETSNPEQPQRSPSRESDPDPRQA